MTTKPILIIGKHAKTGHRVDRRLQALGISTRAVSRSTDIPFDWEDQSTWRVAMKGTRAAYITYQPDLAVPGAEQAIRDFTALATELGLEHLVLLSGRGEAGARRAEIVLEQSGLVWNVVRANWFMQNFSESFMIEGILNGELMLPASDIPEPFVDVDDIADVAVAALTQPELHNRVFEVSGPRAMTFAECVAAISAATGYPVSYTEIPVDDFIGAFRDQGAPEPLQWLMRELFTVVFDGRNSQPSNGVQQALGRPATDFSEYISKVMSTGAWERAGMRRQA
ncbi:MAG: NmrA family NAD(P)-binding protein [Gammaproteobacteria bacterium]